MSNANENGDIPVKIRQCLINIIFCDMLGNEINKFGRMTRTLFRNISELLRFKIMDLFNSGGINCIYHRYSRFTSLTVMNLLTTHALTNIKNFDDNDQIGETFRRYYLHILADETETMREYDPVTVASIKMMDRGIKWHGLQYDTKAITNGALIHALPIGLRLFGKNNRAKLIRTAIIMTGITHYNVRAMLGSVTVALFIAYGLENISIEQWALKINKFLHKQTLPKLIANIFTDIPEGEITAGILYQIGIWEKYIADTYVDGILRGPTESAKSQPDKRCLWFFNNFNELRYADIVSGDIQPYLTIGSFAEDTIIIAYDAVIRGYGLRCWDICIHHGMIHPGDCRATGVLIAGFWNSIIVHESYFNENFINSALLGMLDKMSQRIYLLHAT